MSDLERYGDYNEVDEEPSSGKNPILLIIKILITLVCILVVGVIVFRIVIFNYYPADSLEFIRTEALGEGELAALTQHNDNNYDDPNEGNFFFAGLVIIPTKDHLQLTVRYNTSLITKINEEYGTELSPDADPREIFEFTLVRTEDGYTDPEDGSGGVVPVVKVGELSDSRVTDNFMYRFVRLAFDGVDFRLDEGETPVGWFRLDITVRGLEIEKPYMLPVYAYEIPTVGAEIG